MDRNIADNQGATNESKKKPFSYAVSKNCYLRSLNF
jgi:hypothetical protein